MLQQKNSDNVKVKKKSNCTLSSVTSKIKNFEAQLNAR